MKVAAVIWSCPIPAALQPLCQASQKTSSLLPVANSPLLDRVLDCLISAHVRSATFAVCGDRQASQVRSWKEGKNSALELNVLSMEDGRGSADAIRDADPKATHVLLMPADLICDVPLAHIVTHHRRSGAIATLLLSKGKDEGLPRVSIDERGRVASIESNGKIKKLTKKVTSACGRIRLLDEPRAVGIVVLSSEAVSMIREDESIHCVYEDLLPSLCKEQFLVSDLNLTETKSLHGVEHMDWDEVGAAMAHNSNARLARARPRRSVVVMDASSSTSCCRNVRNIRSYAEANREIADRVEEGVASDVKLGHRTTVGPGCMFGPCGRIGDRSSVKRSVLGTRVQVGNHVKIIQSVIQDDVVVQDGAQLQNCIIASGTIIPERAMLKDCLVGPEANLVAGVEIRNETLVHP